MNHQAQDGFMDSLREFDAAMFVTQRDSELRSRPMAIADISSDGCVWFLTSIKSGKLEEITDEPFVNLSMQDGSKFLSISGTVVATKDRQRIAELWSPTDLAWFPGGVDDPTIVALKVVPTYAEYWDRSGLNGIMTIFELGKSMATGEEVELGSDVHQKVDFSDQIEEQK